MDLAIKGHSGYQIDIQREDTELYIYKSCIGGGNKAERLIQQAKKQQLATTREYTGISVPPILDISITEPVVRIKMSYVYSRNFIEYFESAGFEQIDYFIHTMKTFLLDEIAASPMQTVDGRVVQEKFASTRGNILANTAIEPDAVNGMLHKSEELLSSISSLSIPVGVCHGDLTFSNILFNANTYYLIDFLDSFIESPLMDIVKLRQDSAHRWSALMCQERYDPIRLRMVCKKIDDALDEFAAQYDWYNRYYHPMQILNLLRVLQYANNPQVISYLTTELNTLIHAI